MVLKVGWRHFEAEHEPEGLRVWRGEGAVRLHEAERVDDTVALLLERCVPGTPLASRPEPEQDGVIASLLRQLWRSSPEGQPFRPLAELCRAGADEFEHRGPPADLDPGLAREGIALFRSLPATAEREVLLCTDLHAGNVLAAQRSPWLMIDPKPCVGDPTYDALQHLLNCDVRRVRLRRAGTGAFEVARAELMSAARQGNALFPLSNVHYMETWRQGSEQRRGELAVEMAFLSNFVTIAPARALWPREIEHALHAQFGRPAEPSPIAPLGAGVAHAFDAAGGFGPDNSGLTREQVFLAEWSILAGLGSNRFPEEERGRHETAERFAELETSRSRELRDWSTHARDATQRFRIQALTDFRADYIPALITSGIETEELDRLGADGLEQLVRDTHTIYVITELRRIRYANPVQGFRPTDLNDLRALAVAVVYGGIVMCDRAWADALKRTDLPRRYGTTVCTSLPEAAAAVTSNQRE